jgi:hypothetical protein
LALPELAGIEHAKETQIGCVSSDRRSSDRGAGSQAIAQSLSSAFILACIMFGMGWGYLYLGDVLTDGPWVSGSLWLAFSLALWLLGLARRAETRSPSEYHLWIFAGGAPLQLILLDAGTRLAIAGLADKGMVLCAIVYVGLTVVTWLEVQATRAGLVSSRPFGNTGAEGAIGHRPWTPDAETAFLKARRGDTSSSTSVRWWRILSPILPAVGFALSRNLPEDAMPLLGCYLAFLLAFLFAFGFAPHLAVALHMRGVGADNQAQRF